MKFIILLYFIIYAIIFLIFILSNNIRNKIIKKSIELWKTRYEHSELFLDNCTLLFIFYTIMSLITYSCLWN